MGAAKFLRVDQDTADGTEARSAACTSDCLCIFHVILEGCFDLVDLDIDRMLNQVSCGVFLIFTCITDLVEICVPHAFVIAQSEAELFGQGSVGNLRSLVLPKVVHVDGAEARMLAVSISVTIDRVIFRLFHGDELLFQSDTFFAAILFCFFFLAQPVHFSLFVALLAFHDDIEGSVCLIPHSLLLGRLECNLVVT